MGAAKQIAGTLFHYFFISPLDSNRDNSFIEEEELAILINRSINNGTVEL